MEGFRLESIQTGRKGLCRGTFYYCSRIFTGIKFEFYGYPGDISSWKASIVKSLSVRSAQRCVYIESRNDAEEIKKMTDTIKTDKAKAKFLYEYMQKNMRYVAIQLGIGGFKPFDANFVDQRKNMAIVEALSNYMYALLKAVNIPSYWAIIRRGENEYAADKDFPFHSFNHEILCVPYLRMIPPGLKCTDIASVTMPFGMLDESTRNRNAFISYGN